MLESSSLEVKSPAHSRHQNVGLNPRDVSSTTPSYSNRRDVPRPVYSRAATSYNEVPHILSTGEVGRHGRSRGIFILGEVHWLGTAGYGGARLGSGTDKAMFHGIHVCMLSTHGRFVSLNTRVGEAFQLRRNNITKKD